MDLSFSLFARKFDSSSGIVSLMDDLGRALNERPDMLMLGGGNPASVPAMQQRWRERMAELLADGPTFDSMLGNYDPPQGNPKFAAALAGLLRREFGWSIGPENIAVTLGGQTAFFFLFNLLAGTTEVAGQRRHRKILLPLCPEYIGYADLGLEPNLFLACRPAIDWPHGEAAREFKYRVDFAAVESALATGDIAAMAVSRPTNPTGNVLTDAEIRRLAALADQHGVPLIIDNAYGAPFPGVIFTEASPFWSPSTILTLSLSKLGLPGTRTAAVIGPPEIVRALSAMTAVVGLANTNVGQQLVQPMLESGELLDLSRTVLRPFYEQRSRAALAWIDEFLGGAGVDYAVHASEGAFFHWLWLRDLPIPTRAFYQRLKERGVLVVPGEPFFFGLPDDWPHSRECLRLNFSGPPDVVREGLRRIAQEAAQAG
ncbi:MAG: valine--pyruvate transaminase [Verrucomicrobiales bacterium]